MTRLPRMIKGLGLVVVTLGLPAHIASAQAADPAAPPAAPAAPAAPATPAPATPAPTDPAAPGAAPATPGAAVPDAPADQNLVQNIENVRHYLLTANWPLAASQLKQLAGREATLEFLQTMEKEWLKVNIDSPDLFLTRYRDRPELKELVDAVLLKLNDVRVKQVRDPGEIRKNIGNLIGINDRVKREALLRLTQAGEAAVPEMVEELRDAKFLDRHQAILTALRSMGSASINPLLAAMDVRDESILVPLARVLLDLGYPTETLPYIVRAIEDPKTSVVAKGRLQAELALRNYPVKDLKAGDLFYQLAERFYYNAAAVKPDVRDPAAKVWFWNEQGGLAPKEVPPASFASVMAIRCTEAALKSNTAGDATGLWLSAINKREVELAGQPAGPVYSDLIPAHYWNVRLGAQHLNKVLVRAMRDGDSQGIALSTQRSTHTLIALKAIKSLAEIVGQSNMGQSPLVEAMRYSDRQVRYEAAMALGGGLPQKQFAGQERVVLLLAEAVAQTGTSGILVFGSTPDDVAAATTALKDKYRTAGGVTAAQVINESITLPSVDAILIYDNVSPEELRKLLSLASESPRLDRAARVIMVKSRASGWYQIALADSRVNATLASPAAPSDLGKAIEDGKARSGGLPLDEKAATEYALKASAVLNKIAISRGQVLDIIPAESTLLAALSDARPELAKAAAGVVSLIDSSHTQLALVDRAIDEKTPDEVKIALYKGLASSAKFFGNRLDEPRIDALRKATSNEKTPDVKAAAAEGVGALNLNTEQVKPLILDRPSIAPTP